MTDGGENDENGELSDFVNILLLVSNLLMLLLNVLIIFVKLLKDNLIDSN